MRGSHRGGGMPNEPTLRQKFTRLVSNNDRHHQIDNTDEITFRPGHTLDNDPPPAMSSDNDSPLAEGPVWDAYSPSQFAPSNSEQTSPLARSPWSSYVEQSVPESVDYYSNYTGLMASLVREEGNIYSLAAAGDLLYTGSDSKNIRVWKNQMEFAGFKANSGLVKAIVISGEKIFTGHQDGKIRVWKVSAKNPSFHKKIATLPLLSSVVKKSMKPKNYVEVRRNHNAIWIKHFDAISSLSLNEDESFLYSASWDKTIKVWRVSDFKCLESIPAHDDAVNSVVAGFDGLVFSGSADGTVKAWRRELQGKRTKHFFSHTLLKQECAVTSLVVNPAGTLLYGGSSDGVLHFWEREKLLSHGGVLRGHKLAVLSLAAAGNLVFSGSADTNICVWRREEGGEHKCMYVLNGHSGPVKCLAVEDDGIGGISRRDSGGNRLWTVYSGSLDKSVKIWRVSAQMPQQPESQPPPPQHQQMDGSRRNNTARASSSTHGRTSQRRK